MRLAVWLAVVLAAWSPAASASHVGGMAPPPDDTGYAGGPLVVPLFGHIYDLLQPVPINTQPMIDRDLARGFGTPGVTGTGPLPAQNSLRFYSSPGLVEYNLTEDDGLPRHHPERGVSFDVLLDPSARIVGYWFMGVKALDAPQAGHTSGPEAGLMPGFTVRMTMRVGDDIGADLDSGALIASGQATLMDPAQWIDRGDAIEFVVDMGAPLLERIPGNESFNVKVEWFNAESPDGRQVVQRDWILHTGSRYPNRVEATILNPLALYSIRPTPIGEDALSIHALLNSPFGNYDVNSSTLQIEIEGPSRPAGLAPPLVTQRSFEHNHHYEPVEATWVWNYRAEGAKPGDYSVTIRAENLQGTAVVEKSARFTLRERGHALGYSDAGGVVEAQNAPPPREAPGPAAGLVVAALAIAAARGLGRRTQ